MSSPLSSADAAIVEGMFFMYLQVNLPAKFDEVARCILAQLTKLESKIIHFVTDKSISSSLKGDERQGWSEATSSYCIKGPGQKRPNNWQETLKNTTFEKALIACLINIWKEHTFATILKDKVLCANLDKSCFVYRVCNGSMIIEEVKHLYSCHEEAESYMFFHTHQCDVSSNVVIRTDGTDCLVIALRCKPNLNARVSIWLEIGRGARNDQRYININQLY